jgi:hypothetical protein
MFLSTPRDKQRVVIIIKSPSNERVVLLVVTLIAGATTRTRS